MSDIILVVDDEPGITKLCQRLLTRAGYLVTAVTQPQEGLDLLEKTHFDLLLVDIRMPGMDGFQLIDLARRHHPDLAVVIMTGYGTVETAIEALRRGADGLVLKPFAGADLVQSISRALKDSQQKKDIARLQALRPLFDITELLFSETNPERLQTILLEAICGHLHCEIAALYRRNMAEPAWQQAAVYGERLTKSGDQAIAEIVKRSAIANAPTLLNLEESESSNAVDALNQSRLITALCVPFESRVQPKPATQEKVLSEAIPAYQAQAVLFAGRKTGQLPFRESDLETMQILARQAGVAFENARLHSELRAYIYQIEESQRVLIQAEKMAIAGRLTASIAHEINNPLQAVQNCLHLASRKELTATDRRYYLDLAQQELTRLMTTVQRMLDFYRPVGLDRKPVNINALIQRVGILIEKQLQDRNIELHLHLVEELPYVLAVADQIQQVVLNLALNAMEAMPQGGNIFIDTRKQNQEIEIRIEDTGPGVPFSERKHIFEPFVSTKANGTGLGLAVSYGIVAAHGGSLDLIEGRQRGACFQVTLPVAEST